MGLFNKKTPQDRYRSADAKLQKLRDKRNRATSQNQIDKINKKIHKQKVEIKIAETELSNPANQVSNKTTNINTTFNATYNNHENGVHFHGHYHQERKNKKK